MARHEVFHRDLWEAKNLRKVSVLLVCILCDVLLLNLSQGFLFRSLILQLLRDLLLNPKLLITD